MEKHTKFIRDPDSQDPYNGFCLERVGSRKMIATKAWPEGDVKTEVYVFNKQNIIELEQKAQELYQKEEKSIGPNRLNIPKL